MNKLILIGAAIVIAIIASQSFSDKSIEVQEGIQVMVTTYPLYEFTLSIVGDKGIVETLTPTNVEIHDWEPTTRDLERLERFDILIYNSKNLEPYISKIDIRTIEASEGIIKNNNPHVWLDPLLAKEQVNNILDAIIEIDNDNEEYYRKNAETYSSKLDALHKEFSKGLEDCKKREFIVLHNAYGYLADRYNLTQIPIIELPEADISAGKIRSIIDIARANNIGFIYAEERIDKRVIDTLAKEIDAEILILSPIAVISNEELREGITYIDKMYNNLENLRMGLECS